MSKPFANKVALVTGAASGMGLATARAFAEAGAAVVLADFRTGRGERGSTEANEPPATKRSRFGCDVSDDAQVAAMVDWTVAQFGRLDAAFNNAGVMAHIACNRRQHARRVGPRDRDKLARRVELHETRTAAHGASGKRRDCQQRIGRRA